MSTSYLTSLYAWKWNNAECRTSLEDLKGYFSEAGHGLVGGGGYRFADLLGALAEYWMNKRTDPRRMATKCLNMIREAPHLVGRINTLLWAGDGDTRLLCAGDRGLANIDDLIMVISCRKGYLCCISEDDQDRPPFMDSPELSGYLANHTIFHVMECLRGINTRWAPFVMELLQLGLDASAIPRADCITFIRYLSWLHGVLPPSFYVSGISRKGKHPISGGGFADIWKGCIGDRLVCIKVLRVFTDTYKRRAVMKDLSGEVLLWRQLRHPNILQFLGINDEDFTPSFAIITPWMQNGNLAMYLERRSYYSLWQKLSMARQVVEGLRYLHRHSPPIVHCDIKAGNILVSDDETCRIGDFGLSVVEKSSPFTDFTDTFEVRGSLRWLAPELINPGISDADANGDLGNACGRITRDIYALGCTILEVITGKPPFHEQKSDMRIMIDVLNGVRPVHPEVCPDTIWSLLELCWEEDMESRPEAELVLELLDVWLTTNTPPGEEEELVRALDLDLGTNEEEEDRTTEKPRVDSPLLWDLETDNVDAEVEAEENNIDSLLASLAHSKPPHREDEARDDTSIYSDATASSLEASLWSEDTLPPQTPVSPPLLDENTVSVSWDDALVSEYAMSAITVPTHVHWEQSKSDSELVLASYNHDLDDPEGHRQSEPLFPFGLPTESVWNDTELQGAWKWFRERRARKRGL
ncbi:kinase-like protein [Moniliophthora roreri MCA 2997]|nr:kinase-like protein [Moniliophthora roreri MCA 2997]KAI3599189.1 kinase-like protein [Moniliophthora roreri]